MKKQFTLIELIIVIVVIGLLVGMALIKVNDVVRNARTSAMINDKETLEKVMLLHYQKYDNLPLLNENDDFIVLNDNISLIKMVQAEEAKNSDMETIYNSLQETLDHYNDSEDSLYRIDLSKANEFLSQKLKYGYKKTERDFYVYSTKTNNVYYYDHLVNKNGTVQHDEYDTLIKEEETIMVKKARSPFFDNGEIIINNKPVVEIPNDFKDVGINSTINWDFIFNDEDEKPAKISFFLNDKEYDKIEDIPTKLVEGTYTIRLRMQDSRGIWSDEVTKTFEVVPKSDFNGLYYVPLGTIATGNSTYSKGYASYAIDRILDYTDRWRPGSNSGELILTFPTPTKLKGVAIYQATSYATTFNFTVYGKKAGSSSWEYIGAKSHKSLSGNNPNLTSSLLFTENEYKELKFTFKNSDSSWVNIHEVFLAQ